MKFSMAISGVLLFGFIVAHLIGNLQIFQGPDKINAYAAFLRVTPILLWMARIGLFVLVTIHIVTAIRLTRSNHDARPVPYAVQHTVQANWGSLHMFDTGVLILLFTLFHLAHYSLGLLQPELSRLTDGSGDPDVYSMVVLGFRNIWYVFFYILGMFAFAVHLGHGIYSFFQTLGLTHPVLMPLIKRSAALIAWAIALGYISIPVAVIAGVLS